MIGSANRLLRLCVLSLAVFSFSATGAVDPISARASTSIEPASPAAQITAFHSELLVAMQNADAWGFARRRQHLAPQVAAGFDSRFMARVSSGRYWKGFSADEKTRLAEAFEAFTLANYAARFNGYSGQSFETADVQKRDEKRTFVRTNLVKSDGDAIRIDYLMQLSISDGVRNWLIIDVFVEGRFSELAVRRSEFAPILRDQGIEGLIEVLQTRIGELEVEGSTD